ncbi:cytochrome P450 [Pseudonocardia adelaidensis]
MGASNAEELLPYPIPNDAALSPPAEWEELRDRCPVAHVRFPSGDEATLLTRYDDVRQVLSDPRFGRGTEAEDAAQMSDSGGVFNSMLAMALPQTGEAHRRWRRLLNRWFTARRMAALRPRIAEMAERLVDEMVEQGRPADLKAALGFPLPVWVICDMLGVPDADRDRFAHWSNLLLNLTRYTREEVAAGEAEFFAYMGGHIAAKRAHPGDDVLSELIAAGEAEAEPWSDTTLIATGLGLLIAGHETTANMIGKMIAMLLSDRRRWEQLLTDPSRVRVAVEETLRLDTNAGFGMVRYVDEDTDVAGTRIAKGTTVVCSMAAANRDERAFEHADELDLTRSPNPHLAFGAGPHSCLGQALARTELQVTLEVLLRKLPTLELAVPPEELQRVEGLAVGGLREVPVRW